MAYANVGPLEPADWDPGVHYFEVESDLPMGKILIGLTGIRLVMGNTAHDKQTIVIRAHVPQAVYKAARRAIDEAIRAEQLLVGVPLIGITPPEGL